MSGTFTQILVVVATFFVLQANDKTVELKEELLPQHEKQLREEMARLLEMETTSQLFEITLGSLLLWGCQHWWFWASAEMLFMLLGCFWLRRRGSSGHGSSGHGSSGCGETPAEPKKKRKRRRRRKKMCGIAGNDDQLDQIMSLDQYLEWKEMKNSEEEMEGLINALAKPFPRKTFGQHCI